MISNREMRADSLFLGGGLVKLFLKLLGLVQKGTEFVCLGYVALRLRSSEVIWGRMSSSQGFRKPVGCGLRRRISWRREPTPSFI